jgi:hypothetical protein
MYNYKISDIDVNMLLKQIDVPRRKAIDLLVKHKGDIMNCILDSYEYTEKSVECEETDLHIKNIKKLRLIADEKDSILEKKIKTKEIKIKKKLKSNKFNVILTSFTENKNLLDQLQPCISSHKNYCKKHSYEYDFTESLEKVSANLQKISQIKKILNKGDENTICVWIDSKCLITNNIKISNFVNLMEDKDILLSRDVYSINSDIMIVKNTDWAKYFFSNLEKLEESVNIDSFITNLFENNNQLKKKIQVISTESQYALNSFPESFRKESFLVNFLDMSGINLEHAIKQFENHTNNDISIKLDNILIEC